MASVKKQPSFEDEMNRLDALAAQMEQGELPLEKLMSLYEEGMSLAQSLEKKLDAAQTRMQEIRLSKDGQPVEAPVEVAEQMSLWEDK